MLNSIPAASDLPSRSVPAVGRAQQLAASNGARLCILHAIGEEARHRSADLIVMGAHRRRNLRDVFVGTTVEGVTGTAEREFQSVRRELGRFVAGLELGDLDYHARIIEGIGADAIAGLVEQAAPDLLVIGTRGLSGVKRLFLGSVAQELMGSLGIDVLAVPPRA